MSPSNSNNLVFSSGFVLELGDAVLLWEPTNDLFRLVLSHSGWELGAECSYQEGPLTGLSTK